MRKFLLAPIMAGMLAIALPRGARAADLTIWGLQAFNQAADQYIGALVTQFGKSRGIDAQYVVVPASVLNDRLAAAFQGGAPPDVFMQVSQRAQFYIGNKLVAPLDDVLADLRRADGGIAENQLAPGRAGDSIQALPLEVDISPLFARRDLLDEVGRKPPTTWEELREAAKLIQAKHPQIAGFGMTVSNSNDAEGQIRNVLWSFGGKVMAEDGRTVVFDSAETRAAYQFVADMFLKDRIIPRAALTWDDSGNNVAFQTGRAAFVINAPSIWYWMTDNDKVLQGNTVLLSIPKGPGPKGANGNVVASWVWQVSRASKQQQNAKDWLRFFYRADNYRAVLEKVGGRWSPFFPQLFDEMPMFAGNPAFANFKQISTQGFVDGNAGPPNALAGRVYDANILTKVLQKILVDRTTVEEAVTWGHRQVEELAKGD